MDTPTEQTGLTVSGNITALIDNVDPPPSHQPFNSKNPAVEYGSHIKLTITGTSVDEEGTREINFYFTEDYSDGEYKLEIWQNSTWIRYVHFGTYYYSTGGGILQLTVAGNGTHFTGKFDKVPFKVEEVSPPSSCDVTASFDVDVSKQ